MSYGLYCEVLLTRDVVVVCRVRKPRLQALSPNGVVLADDAWNASKSAAAATNLSGTTKGACGW